MSEERKPVVIVVAEDDEEDAMLLAEAFAEARLANEMHVVNDGEELLDYLRRRGPWAACGAAPRPALILLDLNMPRKDGREALAEIKADACLRNIPVVVLTTSKAEEDIARTYDLGVNSYITKPVTFPALVEVIRTLGHYWFELVQLPREGGDAHG